MPPTGTRHPSGRHFHGLVIANSLRSGRAVRVLARLPIFRPRVASRLSGVATNVNFKFVDPNFLLSEPLPQSREIVQQSTASLRGF